MIFLSRFREPGEDSAGKTHDTCFLKLDFTSVYRIWCLHNTVCLAQSHSRRLALWTTVTSDRCIHFKKLIPKIPVKCFGRFSFFSYSSEPFTPDFIPPHLWTGSYWHIHDICCSLRRVAHWHYAKRVSFHTFFPAAVGYFCLLRNPY